MSPDVNTLERPQSVAGVESTADMKTSKEKALDYFDNKSEAGVFRFIAPGPSNKIVIREVAEVTGENYWNKVPIYEIWQEGMVLGWTNDRELAATELTKEVKETYGIDLSVQFFDKVA